jgi:putative tricarboxylic transport membrane protein
MRIPVDRILGTGAILFGVFLLLYAIPENVRQVRGALPYPAMFPQIAAWLFIGLGVLQVLFVKSELDVPSPRRLINFGIIAALTLLALLTINRFGYLPVSIALMACVAMLVRERRPVWIATIVLGLPIGVWLLFEQVLQRSLP